MLKKTNWSLLLIFVLITQLVGTLSSLIAGNIGAVYKELEKPPLAPPGWLFGIVWPLLYLLIAYAAYRVYEKGRDLGNTAMILYMIQLFFNFMWSIIFFRLQAFGAALVDIVLLAVFAYLAMKQFRRVDAIAGKCMIPYVVWILYAVYLNVGFAFLN